MNDTRLLRLRWVVVFSAWFSVAISLDATSIHFPKFSTPVVQNNRVVCTSADSKRLLCVGTDGTKLWEKAFAEPLQLVAGPNSEVLLQSGRVVNLLLVEKGDLQPRFSVEDENDVVAYVKDGEFFVSRDRRFKYRKFKILDKEGKPLWRSTEVESLVRVTPELIVTLTAERIPSGGGIRFGATSLEAYDRATFKKKWRVPLTEKEGSPYLHAALRPPYLIYVEGERSLTVLDYTTGRKLATKAMELPKYGRIIDLETHGDQVVWLTYEMNRRENGADFNQTKHTLHFCALPNLEESKTVTLRLIEIARIAFEGEFIISDALYRTACFRMNGEKVWERFQSNRTETIGNRIYFSDYEKGSARLGYVEVSTGKEKILYSEMVK